MLAAAIWLCALSFSFGQTVVNGSFETPALSSSSFSYGPAGATWIFDGSAGIINAPGGGFFGPDAPDGNQYAFFQTGETPGSIAQSITFSLAGTYQLSYLIAGRPSNGGGAGGNVSYNVLLDSTVIVSDATTTAQPFTARSFNFTIGSGSHTLMFDVQSNANQGDNTAFVDSVAIQAVVPEPAISTLLVVTFAIVGLRRRFAG